MALFNRFWVIIGAMALAAVIIVATFIMNGSDREDAWLNIVSLGCILYVAFDVYREFKGKTNK